MYQTAQKQAGLFLGKNKPATNKILPKQAEGILLNILPY